VSNSSTYLPYSERNRQLLGWSAVEGGRHQVVDVVEEDDPPTDLAGVWVACDVP
jgi:hypothetical protein